MKKNRNFQYDKETYRKIKEFEDMIKYAQSYNHAWLDQVRWILRHTKEDGHIKIGKVDLPYQLAKKTWDRVMGPDDDKIVMDDFRIFKDIVRNGGILI